MGEDAEPTRSQEPEITNAGGEGWHMTLRGVDLEKWNERVRLSEEFG